jgi:hypothetical protein
MEHCFAAAEWEDKTPAAVLGAGAEAASLDVRRRDDTLKEPYVERRIA